MLDMKTPNSLLFRLGRKFPARQDQRIDTKYHPLRRPQHLPHQAPQPRP